MRPTQVFACLAVLVLAACSAQDTGLPDPAPGTPAFPADGPSRSVTAVETITLEGKDYFDFSGDVTHGTTSLTLQPDDGATAYAVYRFHPGGFPVAQVDFTVTANNPDQTWFGLPDYLNRHWDFTPAEPGMSSLPVTGSYISGNGYLYFAVISHDETDTVIQGLSIDLDLPEWSSYVLDDQNNAGETLSAERFGNLIGIAYSAPGVEELRFAKSTALIPATATDWTFSEIVTSTLTDAVELERINELPMVAYTHSQSAENRFARAAGTSPAGTGDWYTVFPERDTKPGYIALVGINDAPGVAYVDPGLSINSIDYTYSPIGDPFSVSDWTVTEAVSNSMMPPFSEFSDIGLMAHAGLPYLTYFHEDHNRLYFMAADSAVPAGPLNWSGAPATEPGAGRSCRGIEYGGLPALVYVNHTDGYLGYTRGSSWEPSGTVDWFQAHHIDESGTAAGPVSLARLSLGLGVAYFDTASQSIRYAWVESGTPGTGKSWRIVTVATGVGPDPAFSLVIQQNDMPGVAYHDAATGALMYAAMQE